MPDRQSTDQGVSTGKPPPEPDGSRDRSRALKSLVCPIQVITPPTSGLLELRCGQPLPSGLGFSESVGVGVQVPLALRDRTRPSGTGILYPNGRSRTCPRDFVSAGQHNRDRILVDPPRKVDRKPGPECRVLPGPLDKLDGTPQPAGGEVPS